MMRRNFPPHFNRNAATLALALMALLFAGMAYAQTDPGPRGGSAGAGA